jgi:hypothetical protein
VADRAARGASRDAPRRKAFIVSKIDMQCLLALSRWCDATMEIGGTKRRTSKPTLKILFESRYHAIASILRGMRDFGGMEPFVLQFPT